MATSLPHGHPIHLIGAKSPRYEAQFPLGGVH
jgi:hypothetical protein